MADDDFKANDEERLTERADQEDGLGYWDEFIEQYGVWAYAKAQAASHAWVCMLHDGKFNCSDPCEIVELLEADHLETLARLDESREQLRMLNDARTEVRLSSPLAEGSEFRQLWDYLERDVTCCNFLVEGDSGRRLWGEIETIGVRHNRSAARIRELGGEIQLLERERDTWKAAAEQALDKLGTRPQPKSNAQRQKEYRQREKEKEAISVACLKSIESE